MPNLFKGTFEGQDLRMGIVVSRFNSRITEKLLDGALDCLHRHGVDDNSIDVVYVPGSFEIPLAAQKLAEYSDVDAIICLGAVIRGDTPHFNFVASEVSKGVARIALDFDMPVIYGILTTDTTEQAQERAGLKQGNRGWEAAMSALEMCNLQMLLGESFHIEDEKE